MLRATHARCSRAQVFSDEFYPDSYPHVPFYYPNSTGEARKAPCAGNGRCPWTATYQLNSDTNGETFMHPSMVRATDGPGCETGCLNITATTPGFGGASYMGGQLSSWDLMCYQGGYLEVRFQLPGQPLWPALGVWPAIWTMGTLARDTYPATAEGVWPFTYDECVCPGPESSYGQRQRISACEEQARYGLNTYQGRGAPEVDLLETTLCLRQMTPPLRQTLGALDNDTCLITSLQLTPRLPPAFR